MHLKICTEAAYAKGTSCRQTLNEKLQCIFSQNDLITPHRPTPVYDKTKVELISVDFKVFWSLIDNFIYLLRLDTWRNKWWRECCCNCKFLRVLTTEFIHQPGLCYIVCSIKNSEISSGYFVRGWVLENNWIFTDFFLGLEACSRKLTFRFNWDQLKFNSQTNSFLANWESLTIAFCTEGSSS
jgi:hypothetical protein